MNFIEINISVKAMSITVSDTIKIKKTARV